MNPVHHNLSRCWLLILLACPVPTARSAPTELFVSPAGRDSDEGTKDRPFATIERVRDAVRELVNRGLEGDVTVYLRGGTYRIEKAIELGPSDSGTEEYKITYRAMSGEKPVVSGGRLVSGWQECADGTWQTEITDVKSGKWDFRELFVDGVRRSRCRHPNKEYLRVREVVDDRRSFRFAEGEVPRIDDPRETELLLLHDWSVSRNLVKAVNGASRTIETVHRIGGPNAFWRINGFEAHPRFSLENHPVFLDTPGEWYLDRRTGILKYLPLPGETPSDVRVVAPIAPQLLVVRGGSVRNVHFVGLTFRHIGWAPEGRRYAGGQACFHWSAPEDQSGTRRPWKAAPAAIELESAIGCSIRDSTIANLGGSAIWLGKGCRDNAIIGCWLHDIAANGILIGEYVQPSHDDVASGNSVTNCIVERCGRLYFGAVGIWVGFASGCRIEHNEIRHHPYTGVSVGWRWNPSPTPCQQNTVAFNHIHHVMQILSDGGGIYTLGLQPGTALRGNWIHDVPLNLGRAESNGMFLDEGTTSIVIEKNVIHGIDRSPLRFHKATTNLVRENVLALAEGIPPIRYNNTKAENIRQVNNRIVAEKDPDRGKLDRAIAEQERLAGLEASYREKMAAALRGTDSPDR